MMLMVPCRANPRCTYLVDSSCALVDFCTALLAVEGLLDWDPAPSFKDALGADVRSVDSLAERPEPEAPTTCQHIS